MTIFKDSHHFSRTLGSLWWQSLRTAITSAELWAVFDDNLSRQPSLQQNFRQCLITMFNDSAFFERTLRGRFREKCSMNQGCHKRFYSHMFFCIIYFSLLKLPPPPRAAILVLQWACNRHLSMVELPNATRQTGKTEPGDLLHIRQGYYLTTVEWKEFLLGSSLSHLDYGSRNNDLSLVSGICIVAMISQWFSCLAQSHLRGRGWTNFSPLFNDWDDTGPSLTSTSRLWAT